MTATKEQKIAIRRNCGFDVNVKEELVQWATGDNTKTSLNDLSFDQAANIIKQQTGSTKASGGCWASFDRNNSKHMRIMSECHQAQWTINLHGRPVPDLDRLSIWLQTKAPVKKPLKQMDPTELAKTIKAFAGVVKSVYK